MTDKCPWKKPSPIIVAKMNKALDEANAPPTSADHRVLETGFFIRLIPLYSARFSRVIL
jgi:hypothetical protein